MSSVVISGDTSGSITLQAPAVAGSTTLVLPASAGTSGQTLTSAGSGSAMTWATPSSGAMVLLASVDASAASTVDLTGFVDNSVYEAYDIVFGPVTLSTNAYINMRIAKAGTILTTNYAFSTMQIQNSGQAQIQLSGGNMRSGQPIGYSIRMWDDSNYTTTFTMLGTFGDINTVFSCFSNYGGAVQTSGSTGIVSGVRFYPSGGTMTGQFRVYGIKK